jgi:hypothetical protein
MRELTLLETGYLAGGLILCLIMPMLMSFRGPPHPATKKQCMKIVWTGQLLLAVAGLAVLWSAQLAPYAVTIGFGSYVACTIALLRWTSRGRASGEA